MHTHKHTLRHRLLTYMWLAAAQICSLSPQGMGSVLIAYTPRMCWWTAHTKVGRAAPSNYTQCPAGPVQGLTPRSRGWGSRGQRSHNRRRGLAWQHEGPTYLTAHQSVISEQVLKVKPDNTLLVKRVYVQLWTYGTTVWPGSWRLSTVAILAFPKLRKTLQIRQLRRVSE